MPKVKADTKAADNRLKRKGAGAGRKQSKKAAKDPNKPKRPPSSFFVFMSEFREQFKKEHPANKYVAVMARRERQRRSGRQRWIWGSITTTLALGTAAIVWSYLPVGRGSTSAARDPVSEHNDAAN